MSFTRDELAVTFGRLDLELSKLKAEDQPEEMLWEAFSRLIHVPSSTIHHRDRIWWWEQLYSTMERHGLTELSRGQVRQEFS